MITAVLHSYCWAADLFQFIPFYNRRVLLRRNKHGNLNVTHIEYIYGGLKTLEKWSCRHWLTFNTAGECICFTQPKRGWSCPPMKLSNITYEKR